MICINPAPTQMIDGTEKPQIPSKFAKRAARYNEFGSKAPTSTNSPDWSPYISLKVFSHLVSILWILTTFSFDYVLLLLGENWCWSLLRPKGLESQLVVTCVSACLHGNGEPQVGEVTCGGSLHLSSKRDRSKMRDWMDRRVTPPPCEQVCSWRRNERYFTLCTLHFTAS